MLKSQALGLWNVTAFGDVRGVTSDCLWSHGLKSARLLCPQISPGKNTGVGCHSFLQGIFLTQESNMHLLCLNWRCGSLKKWLSYNEAHGPQSSLTGVLIRGTLVTLEQGKVMWVHSEKTVAYKWKGEPSEDNQDNPANSLILDLQPPELGKKRFLPFQAPGPCCLVLVARADEHRHPGSAGCCGVPPAGILWDQGRICSIWRQHPLGLPFLHPTCSWGDVMQQPCQSLGQLAQM